MTNSFEVGCGQRVVWVAAHAARAFASLLKVVDVYPKRGASTTCSGYRDAHGVSVGKG
jgi:hypothetical protein